MATRSSALQDARDFISNLGQRASRLGTQASNLLQARTRARFTPDTTPEKRVTPTLRAASRISRARTARPTTTRQPTGRAAFLRQVPQRARATAREISRNPSRLAVLSPTSLRRGEQALRTLEQVPGESTLARTVRPGAAIFRGRAVEPARRGIEELTRPGATFGERGLGALQAGVGVAGATPLGFLRNVAETGVGAGIRTARGQGGFQSQLEQVGGDLNIGVGESLGLEGPAAFAVNLAFGSPKAAGNALLKAKNVTQLAKFVRPSARPKFSVKGTLRQGENQVIDSAAEQLQRDTVLLRSNRDFLKGTLGEITNASKKQIDNLSDRQLVKEAQKIANISDISKITLQGDARNLVSNIAEGQRRAPTISARPTEPQGILTTKTTPPAPETQDVLGSLSKDFETARRVRNEVKPRNLLTRIKANFLDRFAAAEETDEELFKNLRLLSGGGSTRAEAFITEAFNPILKREASRKEQFSQLLALERMSELVNERGLKRSLNSEQIKRGLNQLQEQLGPEALADMRRSAQELRTFTDDVLRSARDSGLISKKAFQNIRKNNKQYITFETLGNMFREAGEEGKGFAKKSFNVARQDAIKSIGESTSGVADPLESTLEKMFRTIELSDRNSVLKNFVRRRGDIAKMVKPGTKAAKGNEIINFFDDGRRVAFEVPQELGVAIKNLDSEPSNWLVRALSVPTRLLKATAVTLNPAFLVVNPVRDLQDAFTGTLSSRGIKGLQGVMGQMLGSVAQAAKLGPEWNAWRKAGGGQATFFAEEVAGRRPELAVKELSKGGTNVLGQINPKRIFDTLTRAGEETTRLATFRSLAPGAREATSKVRPFQALPKEIREAAFESREVTLDFAKMGNLVKTLNQLIPFFNVGIQGTSKFINLAKNNPKQFAATMVGTAAIPSAILYNYNRQFQDYQDLRDFEKEGNIILMLRERTPEEKAEGKPINAVKVPMGNIAKPFWQLSQNFWLSLDRDDPQKWSTLFADQLEDLSPIGLPISEERARGTVSKTLPQASKLPVELITNQNLFTGQPIEPEFVEGVERELVPKERRASSRTGITARKLGQLTGPTLGISPAQIENIASTAFGGLGKETLTIADAALGEAPQDVTRVPIVRRFLGGRSGQAEAETFERAQTFAEEQAAQKLNTKETARNVIGQIKGAQTQQEKRALFDGLVQQGVITEDLVKEIDRELKRQAKKPSKFVSAVNRAGKSNREKATFIISEIRRETSQERKRQLFQEAIEGGLITNSLAEEIERQLQSQ